jgi:hypothetical protein
VFGSGIRGLDGEAVGGRRLARTSPQNKSGYNMFCTLIDRSRSGSVSSAFHCGRPGSWLEQTT